MKAWLAGVLLLAAAAHAVYDQQLFQSEEDDVEWPSASAEEPEMNDEGPEVEVWQERDGVKLGQVVGLATDDDGHLHVLHRASRVWDEKSFDDEHNFQQKSDGPIAENTHLKIDGVTGEVLRQGGANLFYLPHGLSIDPAGNVWVTDVALHQVMKFSAGSDEPSLTLGEAFVSGSDADHFCKPTDVAVSKQGEIFVADGYCNGRIVKYDADGKYPVVFGHNDNNPMGPTPRPNGWLSVVHSLTLIEDWNMVCVADREHERIQCFSAGLADHSKGLPVGKFLNKAEKLGKVYAIRQTDHLMVGVTNNGKPGGLRKTRPNQIFVVDMEKSQASTYDPGLINPHALAITRDGSVYVGEMGPNRIVKVSL